MGLPATHGRSFPGASNVTLPISNGIRTRRIDTAKTNNILGISCERCHGPGRDHVDYHQQHRETDEPKHIANPADLSPERANDLCSQCHSGINKRLRDPFLFRPGDKLEDFFEVPDDSHHIQGGIHTDNQLGTSSNESLFHQQRFDDLRRLPQSSSAGTRQSVLILPTLPAVPPTRPMRCDRSDRGADPGKLY